MGRASGRKRNVSACGLAAAAFLWAATARAAPGDVSLYRGGLERRGGVGEIPGEVEAVWRFKAGGNVNCAALPAGDRVYAAAEDGRLYCLDAESGKAAWKFDARHNDLSEPALAGGRIYFTSSMREYSILDAELHRDDRAVLYCLDAKTGKEVWKKRFPERILTAPAISGGRLFIGRMDRRFVCLDAQSGDKIWEFPAGGTIRSSAALVDGTVIFGSDDGFVYCLDAERGRRIWKADLKAAVGASPAVSGGRIFLGAGDGTMHCLDVATGKGIWKAKGGKAIVATAAVGGGMVIAGDMDGYINCWDAADGTRRWRYKTGKPVISSACLAGGRVAVGSFDGTLYCLDVRDGRVVWKFAAKGRIASSPSLSGGALYFGTRENLVYRLGLKRPSAKREKGPVTMTDAQFAKGIADAREYNAAGRYGDAVETARDCVAARPDSADAHLEFARGWEGTGELGLAGREYGLAVQLDPRGAAYRTALGKYYARLGRVGEALAQFRAAKEAAPSDPEAYLDTGKLLITRGEHDAAEREFALALERGCGEAEGLLCLAEAAMAKLDFERARTLLDRCLAADPKNARARELRGQLRK
ncbi:MAG: PQQ-binding-like beta-propeller repeat protein [Chlamydiota bacterium]